MGEVAPHTQREYISNELKVILKVAVRLPSLLKMSAAL